MEIDMELSSDIIEQPPAAPEDVGEAPDTLPQTDCAELDSVARIQREIASRGNSRPTVGWAACHGLI